MIEPVTVSDDEAERVKAMRQGRPGRPLDPRSIAGRLRAGEVLWLPGGRDRIVDGPSFKQHGFRVHQRRATRDGVEGLYMWAEKVEP